MVVVVVVVIEYKFMCIGPHAFLYVCVYILHRGFSNRVKICMMKSMAGGVRGKIITNYFPHEVCTTL